MDNFLQALIKGIGTNIQTFVEEKTVVRSLILASAILLIYLF